MKLLGNKYSKIKISLIVVVIIMLIVSIYCISNAHTYIVFMQTTERGGKGFEPTGMQTRYYYEINFITNTVTSYSGIFAGGKEPVEKRKISTKIMNLTERIELKKLLKSYETDKTIYADDKLSIFLIY